jgi:hypothetical protein
MKIDVLNESLTLHEYFQDYDVTIQKVVGEPGRICNLFVTKNQFLAQKHQVSLQVSESFKKNGT